MVSGCARRILIFIEDSFSFSVRDGGEDIKKRGRRRRRSNTNREKVA